MIGLKVEFPIDSGVYLIGRVIAFNECTGEMNVIDREGCQWIGYEYQATILDSLPEDQPAA